MNLLTPAFPDPAQSSGPATVAVAVEAPVAAGAQVRSKYEVVRLANYHAGRRCRLAWAGSWLVNAVVEAAPQLAASFISPARCGQRQITSDAILTLLLAELFLLILRYINLATRITNLNVTSSCALALIVYARGNVTNNGCCPCLRHDDNAAHTGKDCHREKRNCET